MLTFLGGKTWEFKHEFGHQNVSYQKNSTRTVSFEKTSFDCFQKMGVEPKIGGVSPKMDGLFHGKPYEQMDDLGGETHKNRTSYTLEVDHSE